VYTVAVRSQSTHPVCSNTMLWPCRESNLDAAVSRRDNASENEQCYEAHAYSVPAVGT